jgi:predicted membrane-bound spermidine synthase
MTWHTNLSSEKVNEKISQKLLNQKNNQYLTADVWKQLTVFDPDQAKIPVKINRMESQQLVQYYQDSWKYWHN